MNDDLIKEARKQWRRAFIRRVGYVCTWRLADRWTPAIPAYVLDPAGYGVGFCHHHITGEVIIMK